MTKPIFRISSLGNCSRVLSAIRLGKEPTEAPKFLETAAKEGNLHERAIVEDLRGEGLNVIHEEKCPICSHGTFIRNGIHIEREFPRFILTGHMDGIVSDKNKKYLSKEYPTVLEIKSKSQSEFDRWMRERWKGFNDAASQLTVYMTLKALENIRLDDFTNDDFDNLGMGLESLYVVKNRNTGFCDKFTQSGTPLKFSEILTKLNTIEDYVLKSELVPMEPDWSSTTCRWCQFKYLCLAKTEIEIMEVVKKPEYVADSQMWLEGYEEKLHGEALMTEAEKRLKGFAEAHSNGNKDKFYYRTGEVIVSGYPVKGYHVAYDVKPGWKCSIKPIGD